MSVPSVVAAANNKISTTAKRTEQNRRQVSSKISRRGVLGTAGGAPAGGAGRGGRALRAAGAGTAAVRTTFGFADIGITAARFLQWARIMGPGADEAGTLRNRAPGAICACPID